MSTILDIKKYVASQTGKTDWSTADNKRDTIINAARREFYSCKKWSFLKKTASLTFTANEASFPTNFNPSFDPGQLYSYSGTTKTLLSYVELEDFAQYSAGDNKYAFDFENSKIKCTESSATITYFQLPEDKAVDGSDDSDVEPAPDITCISLLATAMWWLAKQRDEDNYKTFYTRYENLLKKMVQRDNMVGATRRIPSYLEGFDLGY